MKCLLILMVVSLMNCYKKYQSRHRMRHLKHKWKVETKEQKEQRLQKRKCETNQIIMGPCTEYQDMYFYDHFINDCREFTWGGNKCSSYKYVVEDDSVQNRFEEKEDCQKYCV